MRELDRLWDWVLPGLISLSPSGAIAYYEAVADNDAAFQNSERAEGRAAAPNMLIAVPVVPFAGR
jgi:hypothetical protein